jgi:hypothetical protein
MAGAFFTELLAATDTPRKNLALPQEKLRSFSVPSVCRKTRQCSARRVLLNRLQAPHAAWDFTSRRADVVRRSGSAHRTSASISTGFSTRPDAAPLHVA